MTFRLDVRQGLKDLSRDFDAFQRQQLPFATAMALTSVATLVRDAETAALSTTFKEPTKFTLNAFAVRPARKSSLTATVYARQRQAAYLEPYGPGGSGKQALGTKKGILGPRDIQLNSSDDIPAGTLKKLKARPDIFIGPVTLKDGRIINGVWQRATAAPEPGKRRVKGAKLANTSGKLKLLIQFEDPKAVKPRLPYGTRAAEIVAKHMIAELKTALDKAIATAR